MVLWLPKMRCCIVKFCVSKAEIHIRIFIRIYQALIFFIPRLMCHNKNTSKNSRRKKIRLFIMLLLKPCHLRAVSTSTSMAGFMSRYALCYCFVPFFAEHSGHKLAQSIQSILLNILSGFNFGSWSCRIFQLFQRLFGGVGDVIEMSCGKTGPRKGHHSGMKEGDHFFYPQIIFIIPSYCYHVCGQRSLTYH